MKEGITLYKDGAVGRIRNRRIIVGKSKKFKNSVCINFQVVSNDTGPAAAHHHERGVTTTTLGISEEGARLLFETLGVYLEKMK